MESSSLKSTGLKSASMSRASLNKRKPAKVAERRAHIADAANQLLNEGKKLASEIYMDNAKKVSHAQDSMKEYSEDLSKKIKANPLTSLLIAGGIGFILSSLLRK